MLFFDEVDALAASRADLRASGGRQLINQFLAELDGIGSRSEGVLVRAATNAPWHLDAPFHRPGRFDRNFFVPPPDLPARASILRLLCQCKPVQTIDHEYIAEKTDLFAGADVKAIVDLAIEAKLREAMKAGAPRPLITKDLLAAVSFVAYLVRPSALASFGMAYLGLLLLPLAVTFGRAPGKSRRLMAAYTAALVFMGVPILSLILLDRSSRWQNVGLASKLFEYFVYGAVLSTWIPAFFGSGTAEQ